MGLKPGRIEMLRGVVSLAFCVSGGGEGSSGGWEVEGRDSDANAGREGGGMAEEETLGPVARSLPL